MTEDSITEAEVGETSAPETNLGAEEDLIKSVFTEHYSIENHKRPVRECK